MDRLAPQDVIYRCAFNVNGAPFSSFMPQTALSGIRAIKVEREHADSMGNRFANNLNAGAKSVELDIMQQESVISEITIKRIDFASGFDPPGGQETEIADIGTDIEDDHSGFYGLLK